MIEAHIPSVPQPGRPALGQKIALFAHRLMLWRRNHRTRLHLVRLNLQQLDDVGIRPETRDAESRKWFWQS